MKVKWRLQSFGGAKNADYPRLVEKSNKTAEFIEENKLINKKSKRVSNAVHLRRAREKCCVAAAIHVDGLPSSRDFERMNYFFLLALWSGIDYRFVCVSCASRML